MKSGLLAILAAGGVLAGGLLLLPDTDAATTASGVPERWLNANHLQVELHGEWIDIPLMPLDPEACLSPDFEKYCD